ncbi:MAG TPA: RNA degradosome polyphosphate kinase, partial [Clostridia bacterium]
MSKSNESPRKRFFNRELSWLEFNDRVLDEAYNNGGNPILERVKFLSIVSSNLDEFFMVRLASLQNQRMAEYKNKDISGRSPSEQVELISKRVHGMVADQYNCFNRSLVPALKKEGIVFLKTSDLSERQKEFIEEYYNRTVYPVLTPMVV